MFLQQFSLQDLSDYIWKVLYSKNVEQAKKNAMMTLLMKTSDFKLERRLCGRKVPFCLLPSVPATNRCEWFSHLGPQNGNAHVNLGQISVSHIRCHIGESRIILKTFPSNYGFED